MKSVQKLSIQFLFILMMFGGKSYSQGWEKIINLPSTIGGGSSYIYPTYDGGVLSNSVYYLHTDSAKCYLTKLDKYGIIRLSIVFPDSLTKSQGLLSGGFGYSTFAEDDLFIYFIHWAYEDGQYICKLNKTNNNIVCKKFNNRSISSSRISEAVDKIYLENNEINYYDFSSVNSGLEVEVYKSTFDYNLNIISSSIDSFNNNYTYIDPVLYQTKDQGFIHKGFSFITKFNSSAHPIKTVSFPFAITDIVEMEYLYVIQYRDFDCRIDVLDDSLNSLNNYRFKVYNDPNILPSYMMNYLVSFKNNIITTLTVIDKDTTSEFVLTKFNINDSLIVLQKTLPISMLGNYRIKNVARTEYYRYFKNQGDYFYLNVKYINRTNNVEKNGIIRFDSSGHFTPIFFTGNVFADHNDNCIKNIMDKDMPQITVTAQNQNFTAYTTTDNNGDFELGLVDAGTYTITAQPNINYPLFQQGNCYQKTSYAYADSFTIDTINLALKPTILCPNMYVDISTPILRRCFSNNYTVNYKNNGTIASPNTYIDVALDRFLIVDSASKPYTNLGNNILRFQLGNVDYLSSGSFTIDVTVRCDSTVIGQTHCVEAHIYPDTVCAVANYNGPVISTTAECKIDSVLFKIKNTGGNMQQRKRYIVIEDNLNKINGTFQLNNGQQQLVTIQADSGKTYGIIAEQADGFPTQLGDAYASAFIEGCNSINNTFTTGFVTQYPEFDGEPYRSVDCQQNVGSYDPNDKIGYPNGVSSNHFIEKNTAIDYHINFQNTGNDTAFKVVIVDTISKYLDINTIETGASSHRYTFMRTDSNTIKFIFDSINLVDSNKNEKLSHGFVKFRIQQKPNNANGTKLYNQAAIYFDYNSPIFTNTTTHTIGDVYVRIISKTINENYKKADIKIYPNPFRDISTIELQNIEPQNTRLILLDISGKEILQLQSKNNQYQINGNVLEKGMYLFKIQNEKEEIANGKLVVQ